MRLVNPNPITAVDYSSATPSESHSNEEMDVELADKLALEILAAEPKKALSKTRNYFCPEKECVFRFDTKAQLKGHLANFHQKQEKFPCRLCSKVYLQQVNLDRHLAKHKGSQ